MSRGGLGGIRTPFASTCRASFTQHHDSTKETPLNLKAGSIQATKAFKMICVQDHRQASSELVATQLRMPSLTACLVSMDHFSRSQIQLTSSSPRSHLALAFQAPPTPQHRSPWHLLQQLFFITLLKFLRKSLSISQSSTRSKLQDGLLQSQTPQPSGQYVIF